MYILPGCFSKLWRLEQQLLDVWLIPGHPRCHGRHASDALHIFMSINSLEKFEFSQAQLVWQKNKFSLPKIWTHPIHFTIHFPHLSTRKNGSYLNDARGPRLWGTVWGGYKCFPEVPGDEQKVGIREAFHFEDEKKQVPSWNARNRTSSKLETGYWGSCIFLFGTACKHPKHFQQNPPVP